MLSILPRCGSLLSVFHSPSGSLLLSPRDVSASAGFPFTFRLATLPRSMSFNSLQHVPNHRTPPVEQPLRIPALFVLCETPSVVSRLPGSRPTGIAQDSTPPLVSSSLLQLPIFGSRRLSIQLRDFYPPPGFQSSPSVQLQLTLFAMLRFPFLPSTFLSPSGS